MHFAAPADHAHEPLYSRTIQLLDGVRVVEVCACGQQRSTERRERRVVWTSWTSAKLVGAEAP